MVAISSDSTDYLRLDNKKKNQEVSTKRANPIAQNLNK